MRVLGLIGVVTVAAAIGFTGCGSDTAPVQAPPDGASMIVLTLENFVDPTPSHYALWASDGSGTQLLFRFRPVDGAPVGLDGTSLAATEQLSSLADGTVLKISLESDTTAGAPGNQVLLAGTIEGGEATLTLGDSAALGVDLTGASGTILLDAPTTADPHDCRRGIWWTDSEGEPTLAVPALPSSWRY